MNDNYQYAQLALLIKDKSSLDEDKLSALKEIVGEEDKAKEIVEVGAASIGSRRRGGTRPKGDGGGCAWWALRIRIGSWYVSNTQTCYVFMLLAVSGTLMARRCLTFCLTPPPDPPFTTPDQAAKISMGQDISPIDMINIETFARRVISLAEYRQKLAIYLAGGCWWI